MYNIGFYGRQQRRVTGVGSLKMPVQLEKLDRRASFGGRVFI